MKVAQERMRPFSLSARVKCRSYSHHLQKAIVDFGADVSFQEAQKKMLEHYRIELPVSSMQAIVENHAKNIFEFIEQEDFLPGIAKQIIAEMDGSIVHGLGDGAKWIEEQMSRVFGKQVQYLVDFFHISEYLAKAAEHSWTSQKVEWRKEQQELLKQNKYQEVLTIIRRRLPVDWEEQQEAKKAKTKSKEKSKEEETPVEKCFKYIFNRRGNLDYKTALDNELPIGSGEIESSHRHVIQKRLKIAGAWWKPETAEHMLSLRILRANEDWNEYWNYQEKAA